MADVRVEDDLVVMSVEVAAVETARPAAKRLLMKLGMRDDTLLEDLPLADRTPGSSPRR